MVSRNYVSQYCPKKISSLLTFLILTAFSFGVFGQGVKFDHLSVKQGLSQGNVSDIHQDKFGFIWIATEDGLNVFDGYTCTIFRNDPKDSTTISNNNINSVAEDKQGNLWIGTQTGLNFYDRNQNKFKRFFNEPENPLSLSNSYVRSVFFDSKNNLWVGTSNGLNRYDQASNQFIKFMHSPEQENSLAGPEVRTILEDYMNRIWVGTSAGLCMLNNDEKTFTCYLSVPDDPTSLSSNKIQTLFEDQEHNLWVGTFDGGVSKMSVGKKGFTRYTSDPNITTTIGAQFIHEIDQNKQGEVWIATDGGLSLYNKNNETFTRVIADSENEFSLSSNIVMNVFFDLNDRMWVGTRFGGVNIYDKEKYGFWYFRHETNDPYSLSANTINSFEEDEVGNFYVATDGGGLNYYDRKKGQFKHYVNEPGNANSISNNKILSVKVDHQGGLWLGYWDGGLDYVDRKTGKYKHYRHNANDPKSLGDDNVFFIMEDSKKDLWLATYNNGICRYNRATNDFTTYSHTDDPKSVGGNIIIYLLEDYEGKIWVATRQNGLDRFDPATETFTHFTASGKNGDLSENAVFALFEDSKKRLWVGTNGGGLNLFDRKTNTFKAFRQSDGLPNDVIVGIQEDDAHNLWISTNKGLSKFDPEKNTYKNYDEGDGLQSDQFNRWASTRLASGELLFGGVNGFNLFDPLKIKDNRYVPPVYVTDFKLFNKAVNIGEDEILKKNILFTKEISLPYSQNFFSFEFTALNYRQTEKNHYKYIMEGFQDEWIDAGTERKVSYTNLNPGEYTFKVIASNNDGVWNKQGTSIKIVIVPPFWRTAWFITGVILLIIFSIVWYIRQQRVKAKRQRRELHAIIEEQTSGLKKQNEEITKKSELEKTQNWINQGLAFFGELISKHKDSLDVLANEVLSNLARYVNAQQGVLALGIKEDPSDEHLKVVGSFASDYQLASSRIEVGEGLIGSVYQDKEMKYMKNIPGDFIRIKSGLGESRPTGLILLPLRSDDGEVHGVIELAFIQEASPVIIEFLQKLSSVIALNIHAANLNYKTTALLLQAKEQTEELQAQEEEMRQSMEELEATQEELRRREEEYVTKIQDLERQLKGL